MFNLRGFIKKGLISAIGKMADYQVILNATGWYEKNVLQEEDLSEIDKRINVHHEYDVEEEYVEGIQIAQ